MTSWKTALRDVTFRRQLLLSLGLLLAVLVFFFFVLGFAENRKGFVIERGWLDRIATPRDFSAAIFACTYLATLAGLVSCLRRPLTALLLIRTYLLLQLVRALALLLLPLDPPEGIIPLNDPFLHATFYNGRPNLKDLFFSGHVASLMMFVFIAPGRRMKALMLLAAGAAGALLMLQRVHYTIDVGAAPFFAFGAFLLARRWSASSKSSSSSRDSSTTIS